MSVHEAIEHQTFVTMQRIVTEDLFDLDELFEWTSRMNIPWSWETYRIEAAEGAICESVANKKEPKNSELLCNLLK